MQFNAFIIGPRKMKPTDFGGSLHVVMRLAFGYLKGLNNFFLIVIHYTQWENYNNFGDFSSGVIILENLDFSNI